MMLITRRSKNGRFLEVYESLHPKVRLVHSNFAAATNNIEDLTPVNHFDAFKPPNDCKCDSALEDRHPENDCRCAMGPVILILDCLQVYIYIQAAQLEPPSRTKRDGRQ